MAVADLARRAWRPPERVREVVTVSRRHLGSWRSVLPLTTTGWVVVAVGVLGYLGGWQLGWIELMVIAAGCLLAAGVAVPFVVGRLKLQVERRLAPDRVSVGEPAVAELSVTNDTGRAVGPRIVEDRLRTGPMRIEVPGLAAGATTQALYDLPTARRGRYSIGPAVVAKADPLGLLRREVTQTAASTLWVHPRTTHLPALPVGFAKDLEGPTTDTSPAGDVSFHTLREYQVGDDYRHIHWLSTARAGTTMVRHYVDNRRPQLAVLLDDRAEVFDGDGFELAVSIAASLGVSAALHRQPVSISLGPKGLVAGREGGTERVLDALTLVEPGEGHAPHVAASQVLRREPGTSALVLLTGPVPGRELLQTVQTVRRSCRTVVVRVREDGPPPQDAVPGARLIDADDLEVFRHAWERLVR